MAQARNVSAHARTSPKQVHGQQGRGAATRAPCSGPWRRCSGEPRPLAATRALVTELPAPGACAPRPPSCLSSEEQPGRAPKAPSVSHLYFRGSLFAGCQGLTPRTPLVAPQPCPSQPAAPWAIAAVASRLNPAAQTRGEPRPRKSSSPLRVPSWRRLRMERQRAGGQKCFPGDESCRWSAHNPAPFRPLRAGHACSASTGVLETSSARPRRAPNACSCPLRPGGPALPPAAGWTADGQDARCPRVSGARGRLPSRAGLFRPPTRVGRPP